MIVIQELSLYHTSKMAATEIHAWAVFLPGQSLNLFENRDTLMEQL